MPRNILLAAAALLAACADAEVETATSETVEADLPEIREEAREAVAQPLEASEDISTLPAGLYTDEDGHAYIAFSYSHQGFSYPVLRFNGDAFEARMMLDPADPAGSTLDVDIDPSLIDSGVADFDAHLVSEDFFDVATHPEIGFTATSLSMDGPTSGSMVGDLTMKGITKPVALDVTLNKVGEHFRTQNPMFGVSARGSILRSDWDLGLYAPMVGDEVDLVIEVEFQKAEDGEG